MVTKHLRASAAIRTPPKGPWAYEGKKTSGGNEAQRCLRRGPAEVGSFWSTCGDQSLRIEVSPYAA